MNSPTLEVRGQTGQPLGMPVEQFLRDYWQKRPLLIRQAFPAFELPLTPDDLGGLGCEESALSRLIEHDRDHDRWTVHTGPLDEALFERLPDQDWTLLVQDVDKWDADVAGLLEHFRFLPSWRIDDVMISYAEDGGGVGAHVDQYDVFLLQGMGRRRWRIDARPNPPTAFRDDVELKILREFAPSHVWTLEPGDMLYLPPGVPHDGVADGACMTFSVGMRAPSRAELLLDFIEHLTEQLPETERYDDPDLEPAQQPGEIDTMALDRVAATLGHAAGLTDRDALADWFGRFITRYRSAQFAAQPPHATDETALRKALDAGQALLRHPWTRMAWIRTPDGATLFVAGEPHACSLALARQLCAHQVLTFDTTPSAEDLIVLRSLVNQGHLVLADQP
ncbi:MAG TPA: cupin domain-containing protein [Oleiagrimonas sp.]|nr:cupin domain-containing protein [Oleiagrimonas sp.]